MRRMPPPAAQWMLEHLTSGDRDEALAGDLLEEFRSGRSNGWYWRQVGAACVVSWIKSLQARAALLLFAVVWCMLSPAWKAFCDRVESSRLFADLWPTFHAFWIAPAFLLWIALHAIFLWTGAFIYVASHRAFGSAIPQGSLRRSLWILPLAFALVYGATFAATNLYWYSLGLGAQKPATAPLEQITDIRLLADVVRLPYLTALLLALWGAIPAFSRNRESLMQGLFQRPADAGASLPIDPHAAKRFLAWVIAGGLLNAVLVSFLLCRLPTTMLSLQAILLRATLYVCIGAVAGAAGGWVYVNGPWSPFREHRPFPFALLVLLCASGWVWIPSLVIFSEQISPVAACVSMVGAYVLGAGLRSATPIAFASDLESSLLDNNGRELFEPFPRAPFDGAGYAMAIGLYAACAALCVHANEIAAVLLASIAFIFAWKTRLPKNSEHRNAYRRAALRLACILIGAVLVTAWALLDEIAYRSRTVLASAQSGPQSKQATSSTKEANGARGYESLILYPFPEKKQIVAPVLKQQSFLIGAKKPLTLRFNGVYRYVQPPESEPGPAAHRAHGTPLRMEIASSNRLPLAMDADQKLSAPVSTALCREIQVEIENNDNRAGALWLALLLTDRTAPHKRTISVGEQPIISMQPEHFFIKLAPVTETVRFVVPAGGPIRKFDEITVLVRPDPAHSHVAPKIAVDDFTLIPR